MAGGEAACRCSWCHICGLAALTAFQAPLSLTPERRGGGYSAMGWLAQWLAGGGGADVDGAPRWWGTGVTRAAARSNSIPAARSLAGVPSESTAGNAGKKGNLVFCRLVGGVID